MSLQQTLQLSHRVSTTSDTEVTTYLEIAKQREGQRLARGRRPKQKREAIIILDFGSQYSWLIARRVRENHVYCQVFPYDAPQEQVCALEPKGFILSGGPASVYEPEAPMIPEYVLRSGLPILGICYGMQALVHQLGGKVVPGKQREYGQALLRLKTASSPLFENLAPELLVWMSHGDDIVELPPGFEVLGHSDSSPYCAIALNGAIFGLQFPPLPLIEDGKGPVQLTFDNQDFGSVQTTYWSGVFGLQFHPEVTHTPEGASILKNFIYNVCNCRPTWTISNFIDDMAKNIRQTVKKSRVICALSGGIDSAVAAALVHLAIGDRLTCIFVDNGLLRRNEPEQILEAVGKTLNLNLIHVDAANRFLNRLKGTTDPEEKRRAIGEEFIRVFEEESAKLGNIDFLAQGTLYPDVIESAGGETKAATRIKAHHNVGGLPERMKLKLLEPLRYLFKDEAREVGRELGLPDELVWRQPFPGPGLAIRIIGEVTEEKLEILRSADFIVMNEIKEAQLYRQLWQTFAVLTDVKSVGVMGDYRTYGYLVAIRAVTSEDAMTADWARLPYDLLSRISHRIANEVPGVNRVVYDITSKPPSTIEWE